MIAALKRWGYRYRYELAYVGTTLASLLVTAWGVTVILNSFAEIAERSEKEWEAYRLAHHCEALRSDAWQTCWKCDAGERGLEVCR